MPSMNDVISGSSADSSCVQQIVDAWKGTAGLGIPLSATAVNDAANWAVDVKNNEAVNSRTFRASRANGTVLIQADVNGVQVSATGGAPATVVTTNDAQTLSNKTITNSSISYIAGSANTFQVPQCRVFNTSSQTIITATPTAITFDSERWDNDSLHSTAVTPSRINFSRAGLWQCGGNVQLDGNASGAVGAFLRLSGGTLFAVAQVPNVAAGTVVLNVSGEYIASTSDYVELVVQHNVGASIGTKVAANYTPELWAHYIGIT